MPSVFLFFNNLMHVFVSSLLEYHVSYQDSQFKRILGVCGNADAAHKQF